MKHIIQLLLITSLSLGQATVYTLCQGNYGSANASLWAFDDSFGGIQGPIHWAENSNPLGDVGQSLTVYGHKLYIVMNNSHTIEIANLSNGFNYESTIDVPNASPRYLEIVDDKGYLTCWNLNGILVFDIASHVFLDTIPVYGLPEDIIHYDDRLYISINQSSPLNNGNTVVEISNFYSNPSITNTFVVIPGPGKMLIHNGFLYVAGTYFDINWNVYAGTSRIDLTTGDVVTNDYGTTYSYGGDLAVFQGQVYRTYGTGTAPLTETLEVNTQETIGNYSGIYSMAVYDDHFYFGLSDYSAPDNVVVLEANGTEIANYQVGALPGSFAFYDPAIVETDARDVFPQKYSILLNYPNPFNPTTTFTFDLGQQSFVTLDVFNIQGEKVTELFSGSLENGTHKFHWKATGIPSGIYFGALSFEGQTVTRKMLLVK